MICSIQHNTQYTYSDPVVMSHNAVYLSPREIPGRQHCHSWRIFVEPTAVAMTETRDAYGNKVTFFTVPEAHHEFQVFASSKVELFPATYAAMTESWESVRDRLRAFEDPHREAYEFVFESAMVTSEASVAEFALESFAPGRTIGDSVRDLTARIHRDFDYDKAATTIATPLAEVMRSRKGVCQDFAHIEIACLRSMGLAARYVSGYLFTTPPPGKEKLKGADESHAWISVYCPGEGWIDFDPTNNCIPSDQHITLAWGRDFADVSPIKGVIMGGGETILKVSVDVEVAAG